VSYLRAGTTLWVPPEVRGDIDAVIAGKATAEKADVATEDVDAGWMWALMAHARGLRFGERFDLELCRGVVAAAFARRAAGWRCGTCRSIGRRRRVPTQLCARFDTGRE